MNTPNTPTPGLMPCRDPDCSGHYAPKTMGRNRCTGCGDMLMNSEIAALRTQGGKHPQAGLDEREAVAHILWRHEAERAAPNVARYRTIEAFRTDIAPEDRALWLGQATAVLTYLAAFRTEGGKQSSHTAGEGFPGLRVEHHREQKSCGPGCTSNTSWSEVVCDRPGNSQVAHCADAEDAEAIVATLSATQSSHTDLSERAAIVAWLREQADQGAGQGIASDKGTTRRAAFGGGSLALDRAATEIEAGSHIKSAIAQHKGQSK